MEGKKAGEIRELSYANYGRIVARLTLFREGTRFALSVSPRLPRPHCASRVLHIKGFSFSGPGRGHPRQTDRPRRHPRLGAGAMPRGVIDV